MKTRYFLLNSSVAYISYNNCRNMTSTQTLRYVVNDNWTMTIFFLIFFRFDSVVRCVTLLRALSFTVIITIISFCFLLSLVIYLQTIQYNQAKYNDASDIYVSQARARKKTICVRCLHARIHILYYYTLKKEHKYFLFFILTTASKC